MGAAHCTILPPSRRGYDRGGGLTETGSEDFVNAMSERAVSDGWSERELLEHLERRGSALIGNGSPLWPLVNRLSREQKLRVVPLNRYTARLMRVTTGGVVDTSRDRHP